MRACSFEIFAARPWSAQKRGPPIPCSSSASRAARAAGSKVIAAPAKLGPDLLELLRQRYGRLDHRPPMLAATADAGAAEAPLRCADPSQRLPRCALAAAHPGGPREAVRRLLGHRRHHGAVADETIAPLTRERGKQILRQPLAPRRHRRGRRDPAQTV